MHEVSSLSDILLNFGRFQSTERKKSQIIKVNKSFWKETQDLALFSLVWLSWRWMRQQYTGLIPSFLLSPNLSRWQVRKWYWDQKDFLLSRHLYANEFLQTFTMAFLCIHSSWTRQHTFELLFTMCAILSDPVHIIHFFLYATLILLHKILILFFPGCFETIPTYIYIYWVLVTHSLEFIENKTWHQTKGDFFTLFDSERTENKL